MKRAALALLALALLVSCSQSADSGLGYISFTQTHGRGVSASITYDDPYSLTWDVTATKTDGGDATGQGTTSDALLTDSFGPYSTGAWTFLLEGYRDDAKVYEGTKAATITTGSNTIEVTLSPYGENGVLRISGCTYANSEYTTAVGKIQVMVDGVNRNTLMAETCTTEDGDVYTIPDTDTTIEAGVHTVQLRFSDLYNKELGTSQAVKVRIVPGMVTTLGISDAKGTGTFQVTVNQEEALVED